MGTTESDRMIIRDIAEAVAKTAAQEAVNTALERIEARAAEDRRTDREARAEIFHLLRLNGEGLATLKATSETTAAAVKDVADTISTMAAEGCAMGKRHDEAIAELKAAPEKRMALVATVVGIVSGLAGVVGSWLAFRHQGGQSP